MSQGAASAEGRAWVGDAGNHGSCLQSAAEEAQVGKNKLFNGSLGLCWKPGNIYMSPGRDGGYKSG